LLQTRNGPPSCFRPLFIGLGALLYNRRVKTWDVVVVGGGLIGLSLARRLRAEHLRVLVAERHEPASEATAAAGGMIAHCDPHTPAVLQPLASASAEIYSDFVHELERESGESADLRDAGTIAYLADGEFSPCATARQLDSAGLLRLEPLLERQGPAVFLPEHCVDPRALGQVALKAAKRSGVDFATGSPVTEILVADGRAVGVRTRHAAYAASIVVNCAGAWAAQITTVPIPTRPVKGQMVCLVPLASVAGAQPVIRHVVRTREIYIIPRSDGRILLGATVEDAGFDKRVDPETIQRLYRAGVEAAPVLASMRIHDAWAGLRPGTPDHLPILGETSLPGYYAATGHYRDGIMLAPITAELMAQIITGQEPSFDLRPFSPHRFGPS
jgi:glycine oxidase